MGGRESSSMQYTLWGSGVNDQVPGTTPNSITEGINVGGFVSTPLGLAKILEFQTKRILVELFVSPIEKQDKWYSRDQVKAVTLLPETRAYVQDSNDRWTAGRVTGHVGKLVVVQLPNKIIRHCDASEVFVRCNRRSTNPVELLSHFCHETPFWMDRRADFRRLHTLIRNTWRGLNAFAAAKVEVFPHQVEVVRRVLEDPVQRYLLADEVGLGKTVEAGIILRQMLLDDPRTRALVVVPPLLMTQWREELADRLCLREDLSAGRVRIIPSDDGAALASELAGPPPDMLVVDEAHHVTAGAVGNGGGSPLFYAIRTLAHATPRLLLLSATPVLDHESEFLAMLHLLDPATYDLTDITGFRERVRRRSEVGEILTNFRPDGRPRILRRRALDLRNGFPEDARLQELLDACDAAGEDDEEALRSAVAEARTHVIETYRLHRRLLRNRRAVVMAGEDSVLADRVDAGVEASELLEPLCDERSERIEPALEAWRAAAAAEATEKPETRIHLREAFLDLLEASMTWHPLLIEAVSRRAGDTGLFAGEKELLNALFEAASAGEEDRLDLAAEVCERQMRRLGNAARFEKVVAFTSHTEVAENLATRLRGRGCNRVLTITRSMQQADAERAAALFRREAAPLVLVCDRSAEEGHNLQSADAVVHVDVPLSPMRLEQRIGRIDRIGRNRPARTRVLSCYADVEDEPTAASAWLKVLAFGFGIFTGSVSDLQFHLEAERERLLNLLFEQGPEALHHAVDAEVIPGVLLARREISAQAEMDAMERDVGQDEDWVRSLVELEDDDRPLREEYEHWICDALKLKARVEDASRMVFRYEANYDRVLSDAAGHPTLVPMDRWSEWPGRGNPLTYCRITASVRPSVRLLRPGDAFIDTLDEYVRWDERGRVYALHRHVPHMPPVEGSEIVCFRVDLLAEADVRPAARAMQEMDKKQSVSERALQRVLQRRADALLPPTYETLYLDFDGLPVKDESLLASLRLPYTKRDREELGTDVNLTGDHLDYLEQVVDPVTWTNRCQKIASSAKAALRSSGGMVRAIEAAADRFLWESRLRQDRLRLRAAKGGDATADLRLEEVIAPAISAGLKRPRLRMESIGVFVLGGNDPRPDDPNYARARRSR